jgi:hypothetical protein
MNTSEKIILGSTAIVTLSAITMLSLSKQYNEAAQEITTNLKDVHYILSKSREDIIAGNKELVEGNRILRSIVKKSSEDLSN